MNTLRLNAKVGAAMSVVSWEVSVASVFLVAVEAAALKWIQIK